MLVYAGASACGLEPLPPDLGGEALWAPIDLSAGIDRGGPTGPIAIAEQRAAGPMTFALSRA